MGIPPHMAVLDDEASMRKAFARLLREHGFAVDLYQDGRTLLEAENAHPSDCILLDLHMPEMDGFAVLKRLALQDPSHAPVIVITGRDAPGHQERALRLGARAYLRKPVDEEPLLEAIRACLEHPHRQ